MGTYSLFYIKRLLHVKKMRNSVEFRKGCCLAEEFRTRYHFLVQHDNCTKQTLVIELWNVMRFSAVRSGQQTAENPNYEAMSVM
jgi:hypothetical protein